MGIKKRIKKKTFIIIILLAVIVVIILIMILNKSPYPLYTEKAEDYNSELYPINAPIFLENIPIEAEIISYSYYNYWEEDRDTYLELKFQDRSDMEKYIEQLISCVIKREQKGSGKDANECFVERTNPYQESYTDLFCTSYKSYVSDYCYTGYEIEHYENSGIIYSCNYGLISYSYEDLIVIQTSCQGSIVKSVQEYTPKYFVRFNVPENEKRFIYLEP